MFFISNKYNVIKLQENLSLIVDALNFYNCNLNIYKLKRCEIYEMKLTHLVQKTITVTTKIDERNYAIVSNVNIF